MPGLLQTPEGHFGSLKLSLALAAEFLGTMFFTWLGTSTPTGNISTQQSTVNASPTAAQANWAPWGNGMSLAIVIYVTANISGGHINPAVTAATMCTGHISILKGLAYILCQLVGGIMGILLVCGLSPGAYIGMGDAGIGCFHTGTGVSLGMLFGWEFMMTFALVSVVYAVAIGEPSFGVVGPFAIGLTLFTCVFAGSAETGTAINPARAVSPAIVYTCYWSQVWLYCIAEFAGGIAAGFVAAPLYGVGAGWLKKLMPFLPKDHTTDTPEEKEAAAAKDGLEDESAQDQPKHAQDQPKQKGLWQNRGSTPAEQSAAKGNHPQPLKTALRNHPRQSRPTDEASILNSHQDLLMSHNERQMADARAERQYGYQDV